MWKIIKAPIIIAPFFVSFILPQPEIDKNVYFFQLALQHFYKA